MASLSASTASSTRMTNMETYYDGPLKFYTCCNMGLRVKANRWTLWTDNNPRHRFYSCPYYESCGYFEWHDGVVTGRVIDLLNKLRIERK
ncbi:conserved hypothetical protein [Ricinus communis]|uniref:Zinc finger GRF-type domain-containing protein n=1 Tax=Ricinus communis TaxID=3988 RepID=B9RSG6_RICCO|nr:conserved hypothetical protein [Ricinus communis]